jgi:uncharacterized protein YuzE
MTDYPLAIVDLHHRSLEVLLSPGEVDRTVEMDDAHLVDVDADGRPLSIEILTLHRLLLDEMAEQFGFTGQLPAIRAELDRVLAPPKTIATSVFPNPMEFQGKSVLDTAGTASTEDESDESTHIAAREITLQET